MSDKKPQESSRIPEVNSHNPVWPRRSSAKGEEFAKKGEKVVWPQVRPAAPPPGKKPAQPEPQAKASEEKQRPQPVQPKKNIPAKGWPQVHRAGEEPAQGTQSEPPRPKKPGKEQGEAASKKASPAAKREESKGAAIKANAGAAWPKVKPAGEESPKRHKPVASPASAVKKQAEQPARRKEARLAASEAVSEPASGVESKAASKPAAKQAEAPQQAEPSKEPPKKEEPSRPQQPAARAKRAPSTPSVASWLQRPKSSVKPHMAVSGADAARAVDLFKQYGEGDTAVVALDHVSVAFRRGEFTAIMGPSGSGKSTLMHCMAGLDAATGGQVLVGSTDLSTLDDKGMTDLRRDRLGFIFQSFNLVPTLTAAENITLPIDIAGGEVDEEWFEEITQRLGLTERLGHRPSELSGGQQQRVACARALVSRPEIIFGDEPTGNLDSNSSAEVLNILRTSVDQDGQTVVIVTHDARAASYADKVIFLADGAIVDELAKPSIDQILSTMAGIERG